MRSADQMVKLGDLLLAKVLAGSMARRITQVGDLVGEVLYMSPESTRGESELDGRSDIYSLGATVYATLTGRPPFEGQSITEVIGKIRDEEPVPPTSYQREIPDEFERPCAVPARQVSLRRPAPNARRPAPRPGSAWAAARA